MNEPHFFIDWARAAGLLGAALSDGGTLTVLRPRDSQLVEVRIDAAEFGSAFQDYESAGLEFWPEADGKTAAYRLLSIHLEEALDTSSPNVTRITFNGTGFVPMSS